MNIINYQLEVIDTLRNPQRHSSIEKMRAYFFLAVYIIAFIALVGSMFHYISGLITTLLIQIVEVMFVLIYAFNLNDYGEKNMDAMQCERSCNPVVDAYVATRVLQILQVFYMGSYYFLFPVTAAGVFVFWRASKRKLHVDATNLWREIKQIERSSYALMGMELILLILAILTMIFSLISRYS